jgi:hypothetical protein
MALMVPHQTLQTTSLRRTTTQASLVGPKSHLRPSTATFYQSLKATSPNGVSSRTSLRVVARASTSEFVPNIGHGLGDVTIFNAAGDPVLFKHLWDQDNVPHIPDHSLNFFILSFTLFVSNFFFFETLRLLLMNPFFFCSSSRE